MKRTDLRLMVAAVATAMLACGGSDSALGGMDAEYASAPDDATSDTAVPVTPGDEPIALAPPQIAGDAIYIPNPNRNTITRIHTRTLEVQILPVGKTPTRAIPILGGDWIVTFNSGEPSVTALRADGDDTVVAQLPQDVNDIAMDTSTGWGLAYVNRQLWPDDEPPEPVESLSGLTIFSATTGQAETYSIGEPVEAIRFAYDGSALAVVVTRTQVFVLDMPTQSFTRYGFSLPVLEMNLFESAQRLFVRTEQSQLTVMELGSGATSTVTLGGIPTDIDNPVGEDAIYGVYADSPTGQAVLFRLDVESLAVTTATLPMALNRITLHGRTQRGIGFVTGNSADTFVAFDYTAELTMHTELRQAVLPIADVLAAPDGESFLLHHAACDCSNVDTYFDGSEAVSLLRWDSGVLTPIRLEAGVETWSLQGNGRLAYASLPDAGAMLLLDLQRQLPAVVITPSTPTFTGSLALQGDELGRLYIAQEHDLGRLSILTITDVRSDIEYRVDTVTGFELNSLIETTQP